jgi:predicted nucleotidyltransferase
VSSFEQCLHRIRRDLDEIGRPWALVGALAVAVWAEARATLDVDVAVAVADPDDAAALVEALRRRGYQWQSSFGNALTSLSVPDGPPAGLRLDLLFSLAGIEDRVARAAETLTVLPHLEMPVARRGDLIAMKLLAAREPTREHDRRDLRHLLRGASGDDLEQAQSAIDWLVRRGVVAAGVLEADLERVRATSTNRGN